MLNQVVLVGRLTDDVQVTTMENGKKVSSLVLAVQRTFKNPEGVYEDCAACNLLDVRQRDRNIGKGEDLAEAQQG